MAETYDVLIKLVGNQNPCHMGHEIGTEWLWKNETPPDMCFAAYNSIYQFATVLRTGGKFPWQDDPDVVTVSCPDPDVVNRFELTRIPGRKEPVESYDVKVSLVGKGVENPCTFGHTIGDEWLWDDMTPEKMCASAYRSIITNVLVMKYGGQLPWQKDPDVGLVSCPDPDVFNRFEIRRIPKK
ncbi:TIGR04076 family protein [Chloroflexota bacterium]